MPSSPPKSRLELEQQAAALSLRYLGVFETGLALMVSDPAYAERQWDESDPAKHLTLECPSGRWYAFARVDAAQELGRDVVPELIACHEFCLEDLGTGLTRLSECGEIPVSSGAIAVFDHRKRDEPEFIDELLQAPSLWISDGRGITAGTGGDGFFTVSSWQIEGAAVLVSATIYEPHH